MSWTADAQQFIELSRAAETPKQLDGVLESITKDMGFAYYAVLHHVDLSGFTKDLDHVKKGKLLFFSNHPTSWIDHYVEHDLAAIDPVRAAGAKKTSGFRWFDAPKIIELSSAQRSFYEQLNRAGIGDGFHVPIQVPGQPYGSCNFAMRAGRELPERRLPMAQAVGASVFEAARSMLIRGRGWNPGPDMRLTNRQLICVVLVGQGLTEPEIARQLAISVETVKRHLKEARIAFGATKTIQVVVRLLYDGQITLDDLLKI